MPAAGKAVNQVTWNLFLFVADFDSPVPSSRLIFTAALQ
jgi:hypothetical protein